MAEDSGLRLTFGEIAAVVSVQDKATEKMTMIAGSAIKTGESFKQMGATIDESTNESSRAAQGLNQLDRIATRMIERMAILYALHGIFDFIKNAYDGAAALETMNKQSDISIEKLQEMQYVAQQTGIKFETLFDSWLKFSTLLARGDKNVVQGLADIGLNAGDVRNMPSDQQIDVVTRALNEQKDLVTRLAVEWELFRNDKLDPAIKSFQDLSKAARDNNNVLDKESVGVLAQAKRQYQELYDSIVNIGSAWIAAGIKRTEYYALGGTQPGGRSGANQQEVDEALADFRSQFNPMNWFKSNDEDIAAWRKRWEEEMKFEDAQFRSMLNNLKAPDIGQMGMLPPHLTETKEDLAAIDAAERKINDSIHLRELEERQSDAAIRVIYEGQIRQLEQMDRLYANNYGAQERMRQIGLLIEQEKILTEGILAEMNSEQEKLKIREESVQRLLNLDRQRTIEAEKLKQITNDLVTMNLNAVAAQNARYGRDIRGNVITPGADIINAGNANIAALNNMDPKGVFTNAAVREESDKVADAFLKLAQDADKLDQEFWKAADAKRNETAAVKEHTAATTGAAKAMFETIQFIGTTLPEDIARSVAGMSMQAGGLEATRQMQFRGLLPPTGPHGLPGYAGGGETDARPILVGEHGTEIFAPHTSGTVLPTGFGGFGGNTNYISIAGVLLSSDPGGRAVLMQAIDDAMTARMRQGRKLPSA